MRNPHAHLLLAGLSAIAMTAVPAVAQTAAPQAEDTVSTGGITEIIVTAQKKAEKLQDVPISIAALGGDAVEAMNAVNLQALQ
ncbi:MAG: hypothetical protein RIS85_17, partial [Pseudomonadota bacterium]